MFRPTDPQKSLLESSMLLPDEKRERLKKTLYWIFGERCLPLIDEKLFRDFYHPGLGAPNRSVRLVVGVLILKELEGLTDQQALDRLEFDLQWHAALGLQPEEAHLCQKTLHNFRAKLLESGRSKELFESAVDAVIKELEIDCGKQRLDSTHVVSDIARLHRLGLFCETIRVFLSELRKASPVKFEAVPAGLRGRYVKDDGSATAYGDVPSKKARRRLPVCARDVYRLVDRFDADDEILALHGYGLLLRLFEEQCEVLEEKDAPGPAEGDADADLPYVPVVPVKAGEVSSSSLQSPHDPDATYSGHKGKGYELQVCETCGNGDKPEIITEVEVTPSCGSDADAAVPTAESLDRRGLKPEELIADTTYGSADNEVACGEMGVELISPVGGKEPPERPEGALDAGDFSFDLLFDRNARCPAGHEAEEERRRSAKGRKRRKTGPVEVEAHFNPACCEDCPHREACPVKTMKNGRRRLKTTLQRASIDRRRREQRTAEFKKRYDQRAGVEATNSELKRGHGLDSLRVRGGDRVELSARLKTIACNLKRMANYLLQRMNQAPAAA